MFTGLIEAVAKVVSVSRFGGGIKLGIDVSGLRTAPALGASIAVNGVCLTVTALSGSTASFDAVTETANRSTTASLRPGSVVNLESSLRAGDALDGHIVQGHVDATGELLRVESLEESSIFHFSLPRAIAPLVAEKGSVAVNGVSLTVARAGREQFSVSLIPETLRRTNLGLLAPGAEVNLEADVLARYAARLLEFSRGGITLDYLRENGFA